jgi:cobalt-zinc-cadmium efflux system outer membrane protein
MEVNAMMPQRPDRSSRWAWLTAALCALAWVWLSPGRCWSNPPGGALIGGGEPLPPVLTLEEAVRWALANNPALIAARQDRGVAAAGVVIANTYPFNPTSENRVQQASGPFSATITNFVPFENVLLLELEIRGQGQYRRQQANAVLTRTDWTVAFEEQTAAAAVVKAFTGLLYRQAKLDLLEETVALDEQLYKDVDRLRKVPASGVTPTDLIVADTERWAARAALQAGRTNLVTAQADLRKALGTLSETVNISGSLEVPAVTWDEAALIQWALARRGDFRARIAAVAEAEAKLALTRANRFGNPSIGPAFTYDPTRTSQGGVQVNFPIPLCNTHRGDILQGQAEVVRANLDVVQGEVVVRQDVQAALARLASAQSRAEYYRREVLPTLRNALDRIRRLFRATAPGVPGAPTVGLLQVIDVQRKLLTARDTYIDTLFDVSQARADLFGAVGGLAISGLVAEAPQDGTQTLPPLEIKP